MAGIRDRIRSCDQEIAAGMPKKIEHRRHRDCSAGPMEVRCEIGGCQRTGADVYNRTLKAAHKKLNLILELGEEGKTELPGALMEVYKISLYALNAKTMLSGIAWLYTPSDPR